MYCIDIPGHLVKQLNAALADAFRSVSALRIMVRFELDLNLDAIVPVQDSVEVVIFALVERAMADNWVDKLVMGARRRSPGNEPLRLVAESLGLFDVSFPEPSVPLLSPDLLAPHRFDLRAQVDMIADKMQPGQLVGFITFDNEPVFLNNLRQRLKDDLIGKYTYCYPSTLKVSEVKQPSRLVLATILANAHGRLPEQNVIFTVSGLRTEAHLASFWSELQAGLNVAEMRHTLVIIFACEPDVPPLPSLYRLEPARFTRADLRLWISALAYALGWDVDAIDFWQQTVLKCVLIQDELVSVLVYDHLHFASEKLRRIKGFDAWQVELQQWSQYYV